MGTEGTAQDWSHTKTQDGKKDLFHQGTGSGTGRRQDAAQGRGAAHLLQGRKNTTSIKSASAEFDEKGNELYSDGEVEITMDVPADQPENQPPSGRLMNIKTSGVHYDSKSSMPRTGRPANFVFDRGDGKCVGAEYDPNTRELHMKSAVELNWRGSNPATKPMKIETGDLVYKERDGKVFLSPWSKLTRDTMTMNAGPATVTLNKDLIQLVETTNAHGTDHQEKRNLEYAADQLASHFDNDNQVQKITGTQNARLVSTSDTGRTTMTTDRIDMEFDTATKDSMLEDGAGHGTQRGGIQAGSQIGRCGRNADSEERRDQLRRCGPAGRRSKAWRPMGRAAWNLCRRTEPAASLDERRPHLDRLRTG